ncbi:MAG: pantoate--beta-alanine ligase [Ignavibacteria bacterium]|jgi:pantoate--beta-alanine ligase
MTKVFKSITDWLKEREQIPNGKTLGFVPTMGALHEGHFSLIEKSIKDNDYTVVSIYVNPTQFNNKDDFENYPDTFDEDLSALENLKVDYCIYPSYDEIYKDSYKYKISENDLSDKLCGVYRPGHFDGVLTIVMKLLNIVRADRAYFGEKDYQQFLLIKGMADAFFMKTEIIPLPTVRTKEGLAFSSRNKRLTKEELRKALEFPKLLKSNFTDKEIEQKLSAQGFIVDYIATINNRRFGAVHLGKVRLIDNVEI